MEEFGFIEKVDQGRSNDGFDTVRSSLIHWLFGSHL
jgi:hypothetical protein